MIHIIGIRKEETCTSDSKVNYEKVIKIAVNKQTNKFC